MLADISTCHVNPQSVAFPDIGDELHVPDISAVWHLKQLLFNSIVIPQEKTKTMQVTQCSASFSQPARASDKLLVTLQKGGKAVYPKTMGSTNDTYCTR